jgi:hypothetical protein
MVNHDSELEGVVREVQRLLAEIPVFQHVEARRSPEGPGGVDLEIRASVNGEPRHLICEVKSPGHPRQLRSAIQQLESARRASGMTDVSSVVVAPYVSPRGAEICAEAGVSFLDLEGNCRLLLPGVYVERRTERKRTAPTRRLQSLFSPKAAKALLVMLESKEMVWSVEDLVNHAAISTGHASNVRRALLDQEWARAERRGIRLVDRVAILKAWGEARVQRKPKRSGYYTLQHGADLERALEEAFRELGPPPLRSRVPDELMLCSFSAAARLAPFARVPALYLYASHVGFSAVSRYVELAPAERGPNVFIGKPTDLGASYMPRSAGGVFWTSPIQTYLDLMREGERGREAARHLLKTVIQEEWESTS